MTGGVTSGRPPRDSQAHSLSTVIVRQLNLVALKSHERASPRTRNKLTGSMSYRWRWNERRAGRSPQEPAPVKFPLTVPLEYSSSMGSSLRLCRVGGSRRRMIPVRRRANSEVRNSCCCALSIARYGVQSKTTCICAIMLQVPLPEG